MKKSVILFAAVTAAASMLSFNPAQVFGQTTEQFKSEAQQKTGLKSYVVKERQENGLEQYSYNLKLLSNTQSQYWKQFNNDYIYNQLSDAEKAIWDELENQCIALAVGQDNAEVVSVLYDNNQLQWTQEEMIDFAALFRYAHSQYWFISNAITFGTVNDESYFALFLYEEFSDGAARRSVTEQFTQKVNGWLEDINSYTYEEEKAKRIHDIIAQNTIYEFVDAPEGMGIAYDQSTYSMVCLGKTVCAGYAGTYQMLANAAGLPSIVVTSDSHAWNNVLIHGYWYGVDVTWDDTDAEEQPVNYWCYNKSNVTLLQNDDDSDAHLPEEFWEEYVPQLKYDSPTDLFDMEYVSPYFSNNDYTYFIVNANTDLDVLKAYPVQSISGAAISQAPQTVSYNGNEYYKAETPIGVSSTPESTPNPTPTEQKNGLVLEADGNWYLYDNGQIQQSYTGLYEDANVGWWYVENGAINFGYNGFVQNEAGWWCVAGGRICFEYSGLWYDANVGWWYVENGAINFGYNGFVPNEIGWWCIAGGRICFEYTGLWYDAGVGWWYVENGAINFGYNGFVPNEIGWWCVAGGRICFEYTGLWYDANIGWWYTANGLIDIGYTGTINWNGADYQISEGKVIL